MHWWWWWWWWWWWLFLRKSWPPRSIRPYFQLGPFLEILTTRFHKCTTRHKQDLNLRKTCVQTFCNHFTTALPMHKIKFSIKDFFSKRDQIGSFLRIWSHLLKKPLMENFKFCAVYYVFKLYLIWKDHLMKETGCFSVKDAFVLLRIVLLHRIALASTNGF